MLHSQPLPQDLTALIIGSTHTFRDKRKGGAARFKWWLNNSGANSPKKVAAKIATLESDIEHALFIEEFYGVEVTSNTPKTWSPYNPPWVAITVPERYLKHEKNARRAEKRRQEMLRRLSEEIYDELHNACFGPLNQKSGYATQQRVCDLFLALHSIKEKLLPPKRKVVKKVQETSKRKRRKKKR